MILLGKHSHSGNQKDFAFYNLNPTINTNIIVNMIVITSSSTYQKVTHIKMDTLKIASCRKLDVSAPGSNR